MYELYIWMMKFDVESHNSMLPSNIFADLSLSETTINWSEKKRPQKQTC